MPGFIVILILLGLPAIVALIDFVGFLFSGRRIVHVAILRIIEPITFILLPLLYAGFGDKNDCCGDSAVFSPDHQLTMEVLMVLCLVAYFYSSYRKKIATPIVEIIVTTLLVIGIVLNIFIGIQTKDISMAMAGNMPIILLTILVLVKNQQLFIVYAQQETFNSTGRFENIAFKILHLRPIVKFPVILIICLPVLIVITAILLFAGQKPDSLIRAFTDTYKHGFSKWDYQCDNVECGGHYLCSVAANGHTAVVKPQRLGIRNGRNIICNRQLLVSNAFEDLLQERLPFAHKVIRKQYNKVGDVVHRYYGIFNNKFVSDCIYILMKPLEWFFLVTLYTFDRKPENRIAKQYLSKADRKQIESALNN